MPVFTCPKCKRSFHAPAQTVGTKFQCDCGQRVQIPPTPAVVAPGPPKTVLGELTVGDDPPPVAKVELPALPPPLPPMPTATELAEADFADLDSPSRKKKKGYRREPGQETGRRFLPLWLTIVVVTALVFIGAIAFTTYSVVNRDNNPMAPAAPAVPVHDPWVGQCPVCGANVRCPKVQGIAFHLRNVVCPNCHMDAPIAVILKRDH